MKLSRASSYALHAIVSMASQHGNDISVSRTIAKDRHLPGLFLLKILRPLVAARLLLSKKGPNGGYRLARPATKITMLEVIEAVDGPLRGHAPFTEAKDDAGLEHQLEAICDQAAAPIRRQLQKIRISDLVDKTAKRR